MTTQVDVEKLFNHQVFTQEHVNVKKLLWLTKEWRS